MLRNDNFEVEEKLVETLLIASIRWRGRYSDCGKAFAKLFREVGDCACGKPMDLYHDAEYREDDADIESAIPVRKGRPAEGITIRELPGGPALSVLHRGPYDLIGRAYEKVTDAAKRRNLVSQIPVRQLYIKGPGWIFRTPKSYLTEVVFMIG